MNTKCKFLAAAILAVSFASLAQPALAHPDDHGFPHPTGQVRRDPCAMSNSPHVLPGEWLQGMNCNRLHAALRRAPQDPALRARCDHAAQARSGAPCPDQTVTR